MEESENANVSGPVGSGNNSALMPIENLIHVIRGQQVMIDSDLARLYGVETRVLNQAVKRNIEPKKRTGEVLFFVGGEDEKQIIKQVNNHKGSSVCNCAF